MLEFEISANNVAPTMLTNTKIAAIETKANE